MTSMMRFCIVLGLLILEILNASGMICGNVQISVKSVNYCAEASQQIVMLNKNLTLRVSDTCELFAKSCTFVRPYSTAKLEILFYKGKSRLFKENVDLCNGSKKVKDMIKVLIDAVGILYECPVLNNRTVGCAKETKLRAFSVSNQNAIKTLLGSLSEPVKVSFKIEHDTGKSCFEVEFTYSGIPKRG